MTDGPLPPGRRPQARSFPIGLTAVTLVAFAILVWLGVWQLQRLQWKTELLARREARMDAPPQALVPALASAKSPNDLDLVRVEVTCAGLAQAPYEELYGLAQGQMVTRLVSPCRIEGSAYDGILVDRGYVLMTISSRPAVLEADSYPTRVVGVLNSPIASSGGGDVVVFDSLPKPGPGGKKLWMGRDLNGMAKALGLSRPAPYFLIAESSTNPDWQALTPGMPPVIIRNNHLQYALTWFGLAGVLAAIYAAMLVKRFKG